MGQMERLGLDVPGRAGTSPQLTIYVTRHCPNCQYALEMAATIRAQYAHVEVRVVELETATEPIPDCVFATPTYLLNGRVWSLGNPSYPQVEAAFCSQTASAANHKA